MPLRVGSALHILSRDIKQVENGAGHVWDAVSRDAHTVAHGAEHAWNTVSRDATAGWSEVMAKVRSAHDWLQSWNDGQKEDDLLDSSVNQLHHDGDQTTLNLSASGKFAVPYGAQAQGTDSLTIKKVAGGYQVTLSETQQAGGNLTDGLTAGLKDGAEDTKFG